MRRLLALSLLAFAFVACDSSHSPTSDAGDTSNGASGDGDETGDETDPNQEPATILDAGAVEAGEPLPEVDASSPDAASPREDAERALGALGQVLFLPFDDPDGVARDRSGKGHDGTYVGTTFGIPPEQVYPERMFNGLSDYVLVPPDPEILVTGEMSILVWVKTRDPVAGDGPQQREILYRGGANVVFGWEKEVIEYHTWLRCYVSASYKPRVYQEVDLRDDDMALRDGQWHHYGVVFRPGDMLDLYVDGQKRVHTSAAKVPAINTTSGDNSYSIGAKYVGDTGALSRALQGSIGNMRLFNSALPPEAVASAFENGL